MGIGAPKAVLPPVQFRAAGCSHRRSVAPVSRAPALVSAGGRLSLSASGHRTRRARAGLPRCAGLSDALALEHDDFAGGSAKPQWQESPAPAATDADRRFDG